MYRPLSEIPFLCVFISLSSFFFYCSELRHSIMTIDQTVNQCHHCVYSSLYTNMKRNHHQTYQRDATLISASLHITTRTASHGWNVSIGLPVHPPWPGAATAVTKSYFFWKISEQILSRRKVLYFRFTITPFSRLQKISDNVNQAGKVGIPTFVRGHSNPLGGQLPTHFICKKRLAIYA